MSLAPAVQARAQEPSVEAYVDPPEVAVGERFRLVVEVTGARAVETVVIPEMFDFPQCVNPYDPAVEVSVGDEAEGVAGNSVTLSYVFASERAGFFEMRPFRIVADGRELETEAVGVLVGRSEVEVEARVDPGRVNVGEEFELIAEVTGSESEFFEFIAPDVFDLVERGESCAAHVREFRCTFVARAPGEFSIPPVGVVVRGSTHESNPVTLLVTDEPPHVEVHATVEAESIWVGGEFVLRVQVGGVDELDQGPVIPETGDFAELIESGKPWRGGGTGGKWMSYIYRFRALRAGEFEIGSIRVVSDGRTLETGPVGFSVDEAPTETVDPPHGLRLTGVLGKTRAHVGEPVILEYAVSYREDAPGLQLGTISWPAFDDFDVVELSPGFPRKPVEDPGYRKLHPRRVALLPRRAGRLDVGAATVEARVRDRFNMWDSRARRGARKRDNGTLVVSTTFPDADYASHILASDPVTLEVVPLPDEGRRASFRGHVGALKVESRVDGTRVKVGERVTLKVTVTVEGHVEGLPDPEIGFPRGFTVSEPEIETSFPDRWNKLRGTRTYTYLLTAVTPGSHVIPAVEMSWFDARTESYGTTRSHPFAVTVVPAGAEER